MNDVTEIHPLVRIADTLDRMAVMLEKMANPPITVRVVDSEKVFQEPYIPDTRSGFKY